MPPPADPAVLTWIVQGGSFALIAVLLVWGGPRLLVFLREQRQEFTAALKEMRADHAATIKAIVEKHESRLDALTTAHDKWQTQTNAVVTGLVDQVSALAARIDARRPG